MTRVFAILSCLAVGTTALADGYARHQPQQAFGAWQVVCEAYDDMGGVTLSDCVALGPEGVIFGLSEGLVFASRLPLGPGDTLRIGARDLPLSDCPERSCATGLREAELFGPLAEITLITDGELRTVSLAGLSDALATAIQLME